MTIILAVWAVAAVAGTVTAVVMSHKKERQSAICDTCPHLKYRNDPKSAWLKTEWACDKAGYFTDPPEICRYHPLQEEWNRQNRINRFVIIEDDKNDGCVVSPEILQAPHYANADVVKKESQYVWDV